MGAPLSSSPSSWCQGGKGKRTKAPQTCHIDQDTRRDLPLCHTQRHQKGTSGPQSLDAQSTRKDNSRSKIRGTKAIPSSILKGSTAQCTLKNSQLAHIHDVSAQPRPPSVHACYAQQYMNCQLHLTGNILSRQTQNRYSQEKEHRNSTWAVDSELSTSAKCPPEQGIPKAPPRAKQGTNPVRQKKKKKIRTFSLNKMYLHVPILS